LETDRGREARACIRKETNFWGREKEKIMMTNKLLGVIEFLDRYRLFLISCIALETQSLSKLESTKGIFKARIVLNSGMGNRLPS